MGCGVAMSKNCYAHMTAEERETLSLGLAQGLPLRVTARVLVAAHTQHRELRIHAQHTRDSVAGLHCSIWQRLGLVSHDGRASSWTRGSGSMSAPTWTRDVRPNRFPGVSDTRSLTTYGRDSRTRASMPPCMCCHVEACAPSCWPRSGVQSTPRPRSQGTDRRGHMPSMTSIADRPVELATRRVSGHWEGDRPQGLGSRHPGGAHDTPDHPGPHGGDGCRECSRGFRAKTPTCTDPTAQDADLMIGAKKWPNTSGWPGGSRSRSFMPIRTVPGTVDQ